MKGPQILLVAFLTLAAISGWSMACYFYVQLVSNEADANRYAILAGRSKAELNVRLGRSNELQSANQASNNTTLQEHKTNSSPDARYLLEYNTRLTELLKKGTLVNRPITNEPGLR